MMNDDDDDDDDHDFDDDDFDDDDYDYENDEGTLNSKCQQEKATNCAKAQSSIWC